MHSKIDEPKKLKWLIIWNEGSTDYEDEMEDASKDEGTEDEELQIYNLWMKKISESGTNREAGDFGQAI